MPKISGAAPYALISSALPNSPVPHGPVDIIPNSTTLYMVFRRNATGVCNSGRGNSASLQRMYTIAIVCLFSLPHHTTAVKTALSKNGSGLCPPLQLVENTFSPGSAGFSKLFEVLKIPDLKSAGNPSWVPRTHPSLPSNRFSGFFDSLRRRAVPAA